MSHGFDIIKRHEYAPQRLRSDLRGCGVPRAKRKETVLGRNRGEPWPSDPESKIRERLFTEAFGGPLAGPRFGFLATNAQGLRDLSVFRSMFAAKMFFDLLVNGEGVTWDGDTRATTKSGITLEDPKLRKIADYRLTKEQRTHFKLGENHHRRVDRLLSDQPIVEESRPAPTRRRSRKGMIKAAQVAKELGMTATNLRLVLHSLGVPKPDHGWAWRTREEADRVIQQVRDRKRRNIRIPMDRSKLRGVRVKFP